MFSDLLIDLIPIGLAAAVSPFSVSICLLILGSKRPVPYATIYAVVYFASLVILGLVIVAAVGSTTDGGSRSSSSTDTLRVVLGAVLVLLAVRQLIRGPKQKSGPSKVSKLLDSINVRKAVILGVFMLAINMSTLIVFLAGLNEVSSSGVDSGDKALAVLLLAFFSQITNSLPVVLYALSPSTGKRLVGGGLAWLGRNSHAIGVGIMLVIGAYLIAIGLS